MHISVKSNIDTFKKQMNVIVSQVPYATALTLNDVAYKAAETMKEDIAKTFTKTGTPSKFTLNAMAVKRATKKALTAAVFVKDTQARYLSLQETGGTRVPVGGQSMLCIPQKGFPFNGNGRVPRGAIQKMMADKTRYVVATIYGVHGLWQRAIAASPRSGRKKAVGGSPLKLMVLFIPSATVAPVWHYQQKVAEVVAHNLKPLFAKNMAKAMATNTRG